MAHILSGCKTSLTQGRYRWCHDNVLMTLAITLEHETHKKCQPHWKTASMKFVRAGEKSSTTTTTRNNMLHMAKGALAQEGTHGKKAAVPPDRPDIHEDLFLWSEEAKKISLIELTVPWEEGCNQAFERKNAKHQDFLHDCRGKGWQAWLFPVEVGCRGFILPSVWRMLTAIGPTEGGKQLT